YDNENWRTNEGNLQTHGAWDLEAHIWKTQFIKDNFPYFEWTDQWYMGMPLMEYYQLGFYFVTIVFSFLTGLSIAHSATFVVILGHLLATIVTYFLCFAISRKWILSAFISVFVLANSFISLRSYGWEP